MAGFTVTMSDPEAQMLREIADKRMTRDDVKVTYAFGLLTPREVDWRRVNEAIVERWSVSALAYVKEGAWRRVRAR